MATPHSPAVHTCTSGMLSVHSVFKLQTEFLAVNHHHSLYCLVQLICGQRTVSGRDGVQESLHLQFSDLIHYASSLQRPTLLLRVVGKNIEGKKGRETHLNPDPHIGSCSESWPTSLLRCCLLALSAELLTTVHGTCTTVHADREFECRQRGHGRALEQS